MVDIENWTLKKFCKFGLVIFVPLLVPIFILAFLISLINIQWVQTVLCIAVVFLICYFYLKYWLIKVVNSEKITNWIEK